MEDELLTISEIAEMLRVSEGHVYSLMRKRALPVIRRGKRFTRIRRSDLMAYLDEITVGKKEGKVT